MHEVRQVAHQNRHGKIALVGKVEEARALGGFRFRQCELAFRRHIVHTRVLCSETLRRRVHLGRGYLFESRVVVVVKEISETEHNDHRAQPNKVAYKSRRLVSPSSLFVLLEGNEIFSCVRTWCG